MQIHELETPCLILDKEALIKNVNRVQKIANKQKVNLKPHIKTHKSPQIFQWQQKAGAIGITASKPDEAIPFVEAGVSSVTLAYPIMDKRKLSRLIGVCKRVDQKVQIITCLDSTEGYHVIEEAAETYDFPLSVDIIIDIGYGRCGLGYKDPQIVGLAEKISKHTALNFNGLLTHNGLTYGASSKKHIGKLNLSESKQLLKVKKRLKKKGLPVKEISVGSTPGVLGSTETLTGISEIRPGNYVFMDRTPFELGLISKKQIALTILSQVISENPNYYIIDAGKKVMSSDSRKGVHDYGLVYPYQKLGKRKCELKLEKMSEEHGFVKKEKHPKLSVGDKVRIIPNHSCVVANLASEYCLVEGQHLLRTIPITATNTSHGKNEIG